MGQDPRELRAEIEQTRSRMGDTIEAIGYKSDVKARAKDSISERVDSVKARVGMAGEKAGEATPGSEDVRRVARRGATIAQENPIGLALGGVAVGFLAGIALPSTRVEDEKLGAVSTEVKQQIKQTGEEALQHGKEVASDTVQTAAETARESARDHAEQLGQSAQERVNSA
jgi:hypothetical protein